MKQEFDTIDLEEAEPLRKRAPGRPPADTGPRRRRIVAAATDLFIANGFGGTTIEDVARTSGLNKRSIYALVGDKEQLFRAACSHVAMSSELALDDTIDPSSLRNSLLNLARRLVETSLSPRTIALEQTAIAAAPLFPDFIDQLVSSNYAAANARVADILARLGTLGLVAIGDSATASELFYDLVIGQIAHRMILGQNCPAPDAAYLERRVDLFVKCCND